MTTHTGSSAIRGPEGISAGTAVARYARTAYSAFRTWNNRRVLAREVGAMDAHMLADIGLTHSDVASAFSEPLWGDPSARLASLAHDRRTADLQRRSEGDPSRGNRPDAPVIVGRLPLARRSDLTLRGDLAA